MSAKQLNPAYDGMTDQQVKRFKYWEFRTMAMCIFGYALFYFVRKNLSIAMPYLNEEMGISKSDLGLFLTLHGLIYGLSKFFNGIWGDRSNARYFLVTGLVFCGICNLLFGFSSSVLALGIFWVLNGWFQGMGVPPCTRLMTHWIVPERLATKMSVWNTSHSISAACHDVPHATNTMRRAARNFPRLSITPDSFTSYVSGLMRPRIQSTMVLGCSYISLSMKCG